MVSYVEYQGDGISYPAYCLDKTKPGVETVPYTVSISGIINDIGLWRRIINGYPYKTIEELGVANNKEAFTATKQAIYCYIHGNDPDKYEAIGEEGVRTLNAMKKIIFDSENSSETKLSNIIKIEALDNNWKQDNIDENYISKTYKETGRLEKDEIKLTDLKNIEKSQYEAEEKLKVLIPINRMNEKGSFKLKIEGDVKTKPVLYGKAPESKYQDYAVTVDMYENGTGNFEDEYPKNETEIIINKKDKETNEIIKGVEFELLDSNKNIVYTGLKTDENGQIIINNVVPRKILFK